MAATAARGFAPWALIQGPGKRGTVSPFAQALCSCEMGGGYVSEATFLTLDRSWESGRVIQVVTPRNKVSHSGLCSSRKAVGAGGWDGAPSSQHGAWHKSALIK